MLLIFGFDPQRGWQSRARGFMRVHRSEAQTLDGHHSEGYGDLHTYTDAGF